MPPTTLAFWRRRQNLESLDNERPQSLTAVHRALLKAVDEVEAELDVVERTYYGNAKPEVEIRQWCHTVTSVMAAANLSEINFLWQIDTMEGRLLVPGEDPLVSISTIEKTRQAVRKVLQNVPSVFNGCVQSLETIQKHAAKYCLSFCSNPRKAVDPYVESARHYELSRQEFMSKIRNGLNTVNEVVNDFKQTGINVSQFSQTIQDLARKTQSSCAPFLLLFPECAENVRQSCQSLRRWIDLDQSYASFVKFDLIDIEKKYSVQSKLVRDSQDKMYAMDYRYQASKRDYVDLDKEVSKLLKKNDKIMDEEARALTTQNSLKLEMEVKEICRAEVKKKADKMTPGEFHEQYDRLVSEIQTFKERLQTKQRLVDNLQNKQSWIEEKRIRAREAKKKLDAAKQELKRHRSEHRKLCVEEERLEECVNLLKRIHTFKTSPEILKKIYHGLPLVNTKHQNHGTSKKIDTLDRAIRVVARFIDRDWIQLYRNLPFYPARGEELLNSDIAEIDLLNFRGIVVDQARQSLYKWRRLHTRANLADLKTTLQTMKRRDILNEIDLTLNPKPSKPRRSSQKRRKSFLITPNPPTLPILTF